MKLNKCLLWPIILIVILFLCWMNSSSISTVLLAIKGTITDGNLIKFSGTAGVGEDAGVASSNVTKNKFDATTAPTVNNDVDEGYVVGSKWYDVTADKGYVCLDKTDGAAVWIEITSLGTTTFTGLTDTPANYTGEGGKYAKVNVGEDALEFGTPAGTTVFTGLTDTPANYTGEGGKYVKVNVGEDALEFGTVAGEANTASNIGSEIEIFKQKTGVDLEFRTLKANSNKMTVDNSPTPDVDIGSPAIARPSHLGVGYTQIDKNNAANLSGTITEVKMWLVTSASNLEVATFYVVSGNNLSTRDTEYIGAVTSGSEQTFEVSLEVEAGDYIGVYVGDGDVELGLTGGGGIWQTAGDYVPCTDQTFTYSADWIQSTNGTGISGYLDYIKFDVVPSEIRLDDLKATEDNTDLNASTTAHGLLPKLDNDPTHFFDGQGNWSTVSGEANTASNVGAQIEIFKQKAGVDLEFRTLKAESNKITISNTSDTPDIDIGNSAINRVSYAGSGSTRVDKANVANLSGTIRSIEIWANVSLTGCEVATFYVVSGDNLSTRDYEVIGAVTAGSKQIFSVNIDVQSGDYIGIYYDGGELEADSTGSGRWWTTGVDNIPCTNVTFVPDADSAYSLYGTGFSSTLDYIKFDIAETEMDVLNLLSATTVAFNADADTTLYTVPTGKRCVLSYAIVVAAGDAGATTTVSIGQNTAETDFVPANTLSNLDAEYDSVILMPIPNTTPLKIKSYAADTVIEAQVASQSGAAGNTIYLFGILY